ncbi:MAG TPA: hypothetical protein EYG38_09880, partial [Verrucomicrobia bacterium]|nr:hypothetical protein [Verrucomicrobiota bacterium]
MKKKTPICCSLDPVIEMWRFSALLVFVISTANGQVTFRSHSNNGGDPSTGGFRQLPASETGINLSHHFPDDAPFILMTDQYSGSGVCIGDIDGDDLPDIYFTNYNQGNRLYRNLGGFRFQDITNTAGVGGDGRWSAGPCFIDIDNDGDLDLYVCVYRKGNLLYINNGKGKFTESADQYNLGFKGAGVMAAFADYDRDGDLDVYLLTHRDVLDPRALKPKSSQDAFKRGILRIQESKNGSKQAKVSSEYHEFFEIMSRGGGRIELISAGQEDRLYRNDGEKRFTRVDHQAGIKGTEIGLSAIWWDSNDDGYPDLYVSNDYKGSDHLYINQGDGTFKDKTRSSLPHTPWLSMGADFADINNDGMLDFFATDMAGSNHYRQKIAMGDMSRDRWFLIRSDPQQYMRNALYLNTGASRFAEAAYITGTARSDWTWCPKFADFDQDGWVDLFITNGMSRDFMNADLAERLPGDARSEEYRHTPVMRQPNRAFRNLGDLKFEDIAAEWNLNESSASYAAAAGDLDLDGDLDLVVCNFDGPVSLFENKIASHESITIKLIGTRSARLPLGAKVEIQKGATRQVRELASSRGFMSANDPVIHFGLGDQQKVDRMTIRWPSGFRQTLRHLKGNRHYTIIESADDVWAKEKTAPTLYQRIGFRQTITHRETAYNDYKRQPLLPAKHSQMGPALAVGDVNGDGRDDVFLGGAAGFPGQLRLMVQQELKVITEPFQSFAGSEDIDAKFFDCDGDSDLDLYVVSGGVEGEVGDDVFL